jgi:hypothetical protein
MKATKFANLLLSLLSRDSPALRQRIEDEIAECVGLDDGDEICTGDIEWTWRGVGLSR